MDPYCTDQLPLDFNDESYVFGNVTASVDNEFSNMVASVGTSSFTPMLEMETLPSYVVSQNSLDDPSINSTSRAEPKNLHACDYCKNSKVKCNNLDNNSCKRCVERGLTCTFSPQKRRGPKPGNKTRSDTSNWVAFQKLNQNYAQKAHKLGFDVRRIIVCPNNLGTLILNYNTTLPVDENLITVFPEWFHPSLPILSSIDYEAFFMNNRTEAETDPKAMIPNSNYNQLSHSFPFTYSTPFDNHNNNIE
ncbi:39683_t:CDS:1 [Gigaspora margarita]|uniref:39683_t:CDS:1 n=1 Tax=Gigaspora margarita TaxID=4874 RepID=A0ABN7UXF4_GIGMA|nr:39683_t:CDS:1 [Gigaspora margarita]